MFYRKNLYAFEQIARLVGGAAISVGGPILIAGWPGWALAATGPFLGLTGIFGHCPACAMIGRKPTDRTL
jgi:hypothetical protein